MQQHSVSVCRFVLMGLLVCTAIVLAGRQHYGEAHGDEEDHKRVPQAERVCHGFVILPNGFAVLSGLPVSPAPDSTGAQQAAAQAGVPVADQGHTSGAAQHLMGYTHGQEVMPQESMLCARIDGADTLRWTAVGHKGTPAVTVESLQGALTHGSQAHAAFALTVRRSRAFVDTAQVRLLARMPHHDQRMPGGHGPAHDPDMQGIVAQSVGQGRYTITNVDFTMGGPWLFEVHLQLGTEMYKVYFAADVGEE